MPLEWSVDLWTFTTQLMWTDMNKIVTVACIAGMLSLIGLAVKSIAQEAPATPTIWTDQATLCQYVITPQGGIEPRMVDNGVIYIHMGCKPNPAVAPKK